MNTHASDLPLVTTDWVAEHLDDPQVRIVEVDIDTNAYAVSHIPGAVGWNWQTQLQHPIRRDIVGKRDFELLLGDSGIGPDTRVVLYGDNHNWFAAHAYWLLRYYAHGPISLMDGGRSKWEREGRPMTAVRPTPSRVTYHITRELVELRALFTDVHKHLDNPVGVLVDVRTPEEYAGLVIAPPGLNETAQRAGHIPGASSIPWSEVLRDDGTLKSTTELENLYESRGIHPADDIITYCRIGERSSHSWFVLKELLGYERVRNYDGSWTEWGNMIGAPVEVSEEARLSVEDLRNDPVFHQ
ncbi:MAG: sulfurtransferase [Rhodothermales bacterium]|nr:sulfurtransferase [Rhodothermales bacterium]